MTGSVKGYDLLEQIGAGGFGLVYRAYQASVGREVAVKVILPRWANEPDFIRRFEVEAQLVARLEHPHIMPLYDYWRDPSGAYLVMRWLPKNLRRALEQGPLPAAKAARVLEQLASALAAAHRQGVIHRDIKPENILLDEDDNAYLADFGIAKDVQGEPEDDPAPSSPAYLSPEQLKHEALTPRADIYSLGVVLYEMLTGRRAFSEATPAELAHKHLCEPLPPLQAARPELPSALDAVLQTATAKSPDHRYPDAGRFAAAFRAAAAPPQAKPAQPLPEPLTGRGLEILGLMAQGLSNKDIARRLYLSLETVRWHVKQIYGKLDVHSRFQAIERAKAFVASGTQGDETIRLWDARTGSLLQTLPGAGKSPVFSPDGRTLLAGGERGLQLLDAQTGETLRRLTDMGFSNVVYSSDGRYALAARDSDTTPTGAPAGAHLYDLASGEEARVFPIGGGTLSVALSPDNKHALTGSRDNIGRLWNLETGEELHQFVGHTNIVWAVSFSPDGRLAFTGSQDGAVRIWDAHTGEQL